jgi:hypothetical protein
MADWTKQCLSLSTHPPSDVKSVDQQKFIKQQREARSNDESNDDHIRPRPTSASSIRIRVVATLAYNSFAQRRTSLDGMNRILPAILLVRGNAESGAPIA